MAQIVAGTPYWPSVTPTPGQYPYLAEDVSCDVAIVGAGATGAVCAYDFAKAGVDAVLLDAGIVGNGSTGISSSTLEYELEFSLSELKEMLGMEKALRAYRACARAVDSLENLVAELGEDVGFTRRDCFYYSCSGTGAECVRQEYLLRRHNGFPVELFDSMAAADKFSFRVEAGIFTRGLAGEINPRRFTDVLVSQAVKSGLRVYENTPVETITAKSGGLELVTRDRRKIVCRKMINATGYAAAKEAGNLASRRTSFCVVTKPVGDFPGWHKQCIIRDDSDPHTIFRTTPDGRILAAGLDSVMIDGHGTVAGLVKVPTLVQRKYDTLEQKLISMFTGIPGIQAEYRFSGLSGSTTDGLPYIGELEGYPNVYYAICCGMGGVLHSVIAGEILRDLYLGGAPQDADLFGFSR